MKDINYYLSLPYTIELLREDETTWFARVRELPGCMTEGDSPAEAAQMIQDAMALWIESALEDGDPIPEPRPEADYSGKFVVRVSRSLHRDLVDTAEREGVSLNQYITTELARSVGRTPSVAADAATSDRPGLQAGMKQVLTAICSREESGALDVHPFAERLIKDLAQTILAAYQARDPLSALNSEQALLAELELAAARSPAEAGNYLLVSAFRNRPK